MLSFLGGKYKNKNHSLWNRLLTDKSHFAMTDYIALQAVSILFFFAVHEGSINSSCRSSTMIKKKEKNPQTWAILASYPCIPSSQSSGARWKKGNLICNVWQLICKYVHWQFHNGPASDSSSSTDFKKTPWNSLDDSCHRLWTRVINQAPINMLG